MDTLERNELQKVYAAMTDPEAPTAVRRGLQFLAVTIGTCDNKSMQYPMHRQAITCGIPHAASSAPFTLFRTSAMVPSGQHTGPRQALHLRVPATSKG